MSTEDDLQKTRDLELKSFDLGEKGGGMQLIIAAKAINSTEYYVITLGNKSLINNNHVDSIPQYSLNDVEKKFCSQLYWYILSLNANKFKEKGISVNDFIPNSYDTEKDVDNDIKDLKMRFFKLNFIDNQLNPVEYITFEGMCEVAKIITDNKFIEQLKKDVCVTENKTVYDNEILSDEEVEKLLNCFSENTYKNNENSSSYSEKSIEEMLNYSLSEKNEEKNEKIKYYDFKRPERLSDDDLDGNRTFGIILAENLVKEFKKKFSNHVRNLHTELLIVDEFSFEEFYRSMPNYAPITSSKWNKNYMLFEIDPDAKCALLKNLTQFDENDFKNREMTESEIKLYKKNIESCIFKALIRSCKKNMAYNDNSIKRPIFTKKEFTNYCYKLLDYYKFKNNNTGCFFTIELSFNTDTEFIQSNINLLLDWKIAKQIADNIAGKKKKQKKFFTNNQTDEKKCFVEAKLGNTTMSLSDVKDINKGTIIDLDKNAFEPITIYVDGKEFAKGEVVVRSKNNNFSLRVTELL